MAQGLNLTPPDVSPFDNIVPYIPLLLSSVGGFLFSGGIWAQGTEQLGAGRTYELMEWIALYGETLGVGNLHQTCWHDESYRLNGNDIIPIGDSNQYYGLYAMQYDPQDGDDFYQDVDLRAGIYELNTLGERRPDGGILQWYVDSVLSVEAQDWYGGGVTNNVLMTNSFTVSGDGSHLLRGVVKNSQSSGYAIALTKFWLRRLE
jgi:hypothetical protein